ncbi:hypothetical protein WJX84_005306 [Apatococcus fuscideae]|uniref:Uncharacterized protein n=1 Tax=Apatococcus fuscideae TaxID=2026836 RepID=A0AAW1T5V1_9CHLO
MYVDTAITFLNGDFATASAIASTLSTPEGIDSIFPSNGPLGAVSVTDVHQGTTTNPNAPASSDKLNAGELAGVVVGSVAGWFVAMMMGVLITVVVIKRHMRSHRSVGTDPSSPAANDSPTSPGSSSLFRAFRKKPTPQAVSLASTAV